MDEQAEKFLGKSPLTRGGISSLRPKPKSTEAKEENEQWKKKCQMYEALMTMKSRLRKLSDVVDIYVLDLMDVEERIAELPGDQPPIKGDDASLYAGDDFTEDDLRRLFSDPEDDGVVREKTDDPITDSESEDRELMR